MKPRLSGGGVRRAGIGAVAIMLSTCALCWVAGWRIGGHFPARRAGRDANLVLPSQEQAKADFDALPLLSSAIQITEVPRIEAPHRWVSRCEDSCSKAKDGVCQEGRGAKGVALEVLCDPGTDCSDCGEWTGWVPDSMWEGKGPVEYLTQDMNVRLFTRTTITKPPIQMLFTDPREDVDVSQYIHDNGILEAGITKIFEMILTDTCYDPVTSHRRLVLDVGANFGYFSVYAAKMGCRVIAWEPVPHFRAVMAYNLAINNVSHLVTVRPQVVSDETGKRVSIQAPRHGIWGTASIQGINQMTTQEPMEIAAVTERIDQVVDEDVMLMKVDVEGFEPVVMRSADGLLRKHTVSNLVFEYSPGIAERAVYIQPELSFLVLDTPQMLLNIMSLGYRLGQMDDPIAKGGVLDEFPALPQIQPSQVMYDIQDADAYLRAHTAIAQKKFPVPDILNCPPKPELIMINPAWAVCNRFPEDAHPKSVRIAFHYNTNIWAARPDMPLQFTDATPGIVQMADDAQQVWFSKTLKGVAGRSCMHVPVNTMVRNRCPCDLAKDRTDRKEQELEQCRAEEEVVIRYLANGQLKFQDNEHPRQSTQ